MNEAPPREPFEAFFARVVEPALAEKEAARVKAVSDHKKILTWGLGLAAVVLIGSGAAFGPSLGILVAPAVVAVFAFAIGQWTLSKVAKDVKAILMARLSAYVGASFSAAVGEPPAFAEFRARKLLPSFDRQSFEDLLEGQRSGCSYQLYEAHLESEHRDKDGDTTYVTVFRGQLLRVAFPRNFLGVTLVLRDAGVFNALRRPGDGLERVRLVDPKFENIFEVFSNDQVEARYLLSPTFMERLLKLEELMRGKKARAAFAHGDLLIAVEGGNLFEAGSMFEPLATPARAKRVLDEIDTVHAMIDSLLDSPTAAGAVT